MLCFVEIGDWRTLRMFFAHPAVKKIMKPQSRGVWPYALTCRKGRNLIQNGEFKIKNGEWNNYKP